MVTINLLVALICFKIPPVALTVGMKAKFITLPNEKITRSYGRIRTKFSG